MRLNSIHEVIKELDDWMKHYIQWSKYPETKDVAFLKSEAIEKARNILAEAFGEKENNNG